MDHVFDLEKGQTININGTIKVVFQGLKKSTMVTLGVEAPKEILILRGELYAKDDQNRTRKNRR